MSNKHLIRKYQSYISTIQWHIDTNRPSEEEIKKLTNRIKLWNEIIFDLLTQVKEEGKREISKDEELIGKIKYATAGMCISDLAANRCVKEATEIAVQHFTEKVKSLHNKYDHGEVSNIYNLAIFDVLELFK